MEYGCIGEKLKHSFSKEIHALLTDYNYEIKEIPKDSLREFMLAKNFRAINVTIPYKRDVIPFLDFVSDTAKSINAVNTIVNKNGKLYGYNTDFFGMTELINREGIEIAGKKVLILGSGGTSSTACAVVKALNAKSVYTVSRSGGDGRITYEQAYKEHSDADVIINTTPVGMYPNPDDMPIDLGKFKMLSGVVDAVYNPLRTKLVLEAKKRGIKATGGLYMLVAQAARAVELFLDKEIDPKKTEEVYRKIKVQKQNIVLIGMPSSGKSTIGEKLAKRIEFDFVDTDVIIVNRAKMPITEIFKSVGEQGFRKLESEVIAEISKNSGVLISTGGGAILNPKNVENLRQNGMIYFIDRPLEWLTATEDRPLSSNKADLEKLYEERYPKYKSAADVSFLADDNIEVNLKFILDNIRK